MKQDHKKTHIMCWSYLFSTYYIGNLTIKSILQMVTRYYVVLRLKHENHYYMHDGNASSTKVVTESWINDSRICPKNLPIQKGKLLAVYIRNSLSISS